MARYVQGLVPADVEQLPAYLAQELEKIAQAFFVTDEVQLTPQHSAPERPRDGLIVMADGTNWNPGGTGSQHLVAYLNNAWVKIS